MQVISSISVLAIILIGSTFAFFRAQQNGTSTNDISAISNTTDNLTFQISNDISFTASTANFYQEINNVSDESIATSTLTPNNKTNQETIKKDLTVLFLFEFFVAPFIFFRYN